MYTGHTRENNKCKSCAHNTGYSVNGGNSGLYESSRYILVTLVSGNGGNSGYRGLYESSRYILVTLVTVATVVTGYYIGFKIFFGYSGYRGIYLFQDIS